MLNKIKTLLFENQNHKQTIAKNTFWLFFGQIGGRVLRAILIIFAARVLGPESWGAFSYATTLAVFLLLLSDIGVSAIVTRESARNPELSHQYFSTAFFLKISFLLVGVSFLIFGGPLITNIPEARSLLPLIAILLIFDSIRNFGFTISRAMEKMQWEAINEIATNFLIIIAGFYFLTTAPSSAGLTLAYVLGTGLGMIFTIILLKDYFKNIFTHFQYRLIRPIISSSLPFALASFLGAIMINTDLIMLGWLRSPAEVGFYSAAQKPIQVLYTLASLFAVSLFPVLTKFAAEKERSKKLLENSIITSLFFALPITFNGLILSQPLINLLFGSEYAPANAAFQILILTLPIIFSSVIISNSLLAHDQQNKFIWFSALGAIGNVVFNFLLIPILGILGCALSTLITQIIANSFIWKKMKETVNFSIVKKTLKIVAASIVSAAAALLLNNSNIPVLINIPIIIVIYWGLLIAFKEKLIKEII